MSRLADATWPEVASGDRRLLVVPVGSTEQHGPHLPLSTDTLIAEAVAAALHERLSGAGLAPAIPIGAAGEHAGFPGTLSIGTEALRAVIVELVRYAADDWSAVLLVNGHGGNADAIRSAIEVCRYEGRSLAAVHCGVPGMDAHAGRAETSLMLHLHPSLVRSDWTEPGNTAPVAELLPEMRTGGVRAVSPNGVLGDPRGASAEEGAELFTALLDQALSQLPQK